MFSTTSFTSQIAISSISAVAPEKAVVATWVSGSLAFRPHEARFALPRTGTCASAWLVPQRTRRSRAASCSATSPATSSWSAGSLYPDPNFASCVSSGRPHRLAVGLSHVAWRVPLCLSFSAASAVAFVWRLRSHRRCLTLLLSIFPMRLLRGPRPLLIIN